MNIVEIGAVIYVANVILSIVIALMIIDKLYISKKFSKEKDFHLYNDLFSWEMFFIFIGIANVINILSILIQPTAEIPDFFLKIRLFILFFAIWIKIIHLEKVMDKITYERHYIAGVIPCIFTLVFILIDVPILILSLIFLGTSLIPYMILVLIYRNTSTLNKKSMKIIFGLICLVTGFVFVPALIADFVRAPETLDLIIIVAPILIIIGNLLIFESFRKELLK